jgi:iron complex transport system permease protein
VKKIFLFPLLFLLLVSVSMLAVFLGTWGIAPSDIFSAITGEGVDERISQIVWQIRLPRIFLGAIVGMGLAASGAAFQGMLRNPLADPYTLGIASGAALGAAIGIVWQLPIIGLVLFAFCGALAASCFVFMLAAHKGFSVSSVILSGVIASFLLSSTIMVLLAVFQAKDAKASMMFLMGDLSMMHPALLKWTAGLVGMGILFLTGLGRALDAMTLGEEKATSLGIHPATVQKAVFLTTSVIIGVSVAVSGVIGFVGLMIPHLMRKFAGSHHRILIPASALTGGTLMVVCDTIARTIASPVDLPVGAITGFLGALFFLGFFLRAGQWKLF